MPATYHVTISGDAGVADPAVANSGDLRWCITQSQNAANNDIDFHLAKNTPIQPTTALPDITQTGTVINGETQFGYAGFPQVVIDGTLAGQTSCFTIKTSGCVVKGLEIQNFQSNGVVIKAGPTAAGNNQIYHNMIEYNGIDGVSITDSPDCTIEMERWASATPAMVWL